MSRETAWTANHCRDCCCAQSWKALGITNYTGKSIPEHIAELRAYVQSRAAAGDPEAEMLVKQVEGEG